MTVIKIEKYGARWCNQCKALEPVLDELKDIEILYYDADNSEHASKFADRLVRNIPVLVFTDDDGNEVDRLVGVVSLQDIHKIIDKHKPERDGGESESSEPLQMVEGSVRD